MNRNFGIKLQLLGIGLLVYAVFSLGFSGGEDFASRVITFIGIFSPFIGLLLCIAGLFYKKK